MCQECKHHVCATMQPVAVSRSCTGAPPPHSLGVAWGEVVGILQLPANFLLVRGFHLGEHGCNCATAGCPFYATKHGIDLGGSPAACAEQHVSCPTLARVGWTGQVLMSRATRMPYTCKRHTNQCWARTHAHTHARTHAPIHAHSFTADNSGVLPAHSLHHALTCAACCVCGPPPAASPGQTAQSQSRSSARSWCLWLLPLHGTCRCWSAPTGPRPVAHSNRGRCVRRLQGMMQHVPNPCSSLL